MAGGTIDNCLNTLHIGLPGTIGTPMRVRDLDTKGNALVAKLALSHPLHLLAVAYFRAIRNGTGDMITELFRKSKQNFQNYSTFFIILEKGESVAESGDIIYNVNV